MVLPGLLLGIIFYLDGRVFNVRWTKIVLVLLLTACRSVFAQDTFEVSGYIDSTAVILAPELQGAVASLESGDPVAAAVELRDILRRNPEQGQAWRLLASAYLRLDDFAQAIDACRQPLAILIILTQLL